MERLKNSLLMVSICSKKSFAQRSHLFSQRSHHIRMRKEEKIDDFSEQMISLSKQKPSEENFSVFPLPNPLRICIVTLHISQVKGKLSLPLSAFHLLTGSYLFLEIETFLLQPQFSLSAPPPIKSCFDSTSYLVFRQSLICIR